MPFVRVVCDTLKSPSRWPYPDAAARLLPTEISSQFLLYETRLEDLSDEVMALNQRMEQYLNTITKRAENYRTCQS